MLEYGFFFRFTKFHTHFLSARRAHKGCWDGFKMAETDTPGVKNLLFVCALLGAGFTSARSEVNFSNAWLYLLSLHSFL